MPSKLEPNSPYADLPDRAFWRRGVTTAGLRSLYDPKWPITAETRIATAGSCFAQHIGTRLRKAGVDVLDAEPAPAVMPDSVANAYGYRLFSGRYGNIYTARQMRQLLGDVIDGHLDPRFVWETERGRYVDAFRPTVEPDGLETAAEVLVHRDYHLERTAQMLRGTDVFIFTLGLTEVWGDRATGRVFPICPGIAGGSYSADEHALHQFRYAEVMEDMKAVHAALRRFNKDMRLLLTVSPVPLTATASSDHVLTATTRAKATLRAVAGDLAADFADIDYFPSYELVTSHATGGPWFGNNRRSVRSDGVDMVMAHFLAAHGLSEVSRNAAAQTAATPEAQMDDDEDGLVCDELLLQAAAR